MSFPDCPDPRVPDSDVRCEAMTKPCKDTYQVWRRESHRCIRRAVLSRAGRGVCALHGRMPSVNYWDGSPDTFRHRTFSVRK